MAEGLLRNFYGEKYEAYSAGSTPTRVHPLAIKAMAEIGIDISKQSSKNIEDYKGRGFDLVVTVCKNTPRLACPFCSPPGRLGPPRIIQETLPDAKRFVEHGFDDPSAVEGADDDKLEAFRRIRDEMRKWIETNFTDLEKVE
jgi:arsenate reductase